MNKLVTVGLQVPLIGFIGVGSVGATTAEGEEAEAVIAAIEQTAPEVFAHSETERAAIESVVPAGSETSLVLASDAGHVVGVKLPFAQSATDVANRDGQAIIDNGNDSKTVPVVKDDGSVQVTTVIESISAPVEYLYEFEAVGSIRIEGVEETSVLRVVGGTDETLAWILEPWAFDASGAEIETWYTVEGAKVVQHVNHTEPGTAYPVIADPYLGQALFSATGTSVNRVNSRYVDVWARKSAFGQALHQPLGGTAVYLNEGWAELKAKRPVVATQLTYRHQYDCHAVYGYGNLGGSEWNLEGHRPQKPGYSAGVVTHQCNW